MSDHNEKIQSMIQQIKSKFEERVNTIKQSGANQIEQIEDDNPDPSTVEAILMMVFDVKWKTTSIKFDVPQFSMKLQSIKFDVPEVHMKLKSFKFDIPRTRMVIKCVVGNPFGGGCLVKTKVPEVYMHRVEIKTDIPEFHSKRVEIKLHIPEVSMETVEIKFDLPQFYLRSLDDVLDNQERNIQEVSNEMTADLARAEGDMKIEMKEGLTHEIEVMFSQMTDEVLVKRDEVSDQYEAAIAKTKAAIIDLKKNNATAEVQKLESELGEIVTDFKRIMDDFDNSIVLIHEQKNQTLASLVL
ncbi:hypothetical protein [Phaeocystidibacter marisrubri]|uniref:Uncharacterized protein n=1 Tax=Phaeocystidibacter marisrubri TaxID=1577780 RepID=A0A6L3ZG99_9FLAO|nr:hypothetical protein [Phaeocystidibacter marisrubri]KAB2816488.1 hypothetical protein F8C82_12465 [Phaeocystidibacter marisrubri]GGH69309.1 hypothetical protein GCM10011318_10190 [Phaeocystidibacter marisrubri]